MSSLPGFKPQPPRHKDVITLLPPPPLPPLPRLHVMPPPPPLPLPLPRKEVAPPPDQLDDARTNNFDYDRVLMRNTAMDRIVTTIGHTGARVGRLVERMRHAYQLRLVVRMQALKVQGRPNNAQLNKWVVSVYKLFGFAVLTLIVLALFAYLGSTLFYWYSTSWIMPTVIAPTDEHVLQLSSTLAVQASARDKLKADVADADRVVVMDAQFLDEAKKAIADQLGDRQAQLSHLLALHKNFSSTRADVHNNSKLYSSLSRRRLSAEYDAHMIDREGAVTGAFQLSQIAAGNLSLAEKAVELDTQTSDLIRETSSLAAILGKNSTRRRYSYEVLKMLSDVKRAELELAKARDYRKALGSSLERYQALVTTIEDSAYLRAASHKDTIAQVPYDNLDKVKPGAPLYSCALGLFVCHKVGSVVAVLPGEMVFKHPLHNTMLRGQAVQLRLDDAKTAEKPVLFAGGRPILF